LSIPVQTGIHVVMIGTDRTVFMNNAPSDTLARQIEYGNTLENLCPGSRLSIIVECRDLVASRFEKGNIVFIPVQGKRPFCLMRVYKTLAAIERERPIDVISPQTVFDDAWISLIFKKIHGPAVVGQLHFDMFNEHAKAGMMGHGIKAGIRHRLGLEAIRRMQAVRVVGRSIKNNIEKHGLNRNVSLLPVPVTMKPASDNTEKESAKSILAVGRLVFDKNISDWLRVAKIVADSDSDVGFDIVGDGPLRGELEEQSQGLGLQDRVTFHGAIPYEQLPPVYRKAGVFLLTSHFEGFGRVIVESYLNGTPVVAPRITGPEDIIENGVSGFLHEPGDIEGMAESVLKIINDPNLSRAMVEAGREFIRGQFDPKKLTLEWMKLLAETAGSQSGNIIKPLRSTFSRWLHLSRGSRSLLRSLQYERLEGIEIEGKSIDLGGGAKADYLDLIRIKGSLESININPAMKPDITADLNKPLPIETGTYDNVISFNTFEHIKNEDLLMTEMLRIMKPGGSAHIMVPFLFREHGSPQDYSRHTASWWIDKLTESGAAAGSISVEPLVWSRTASAIANLEEGSSGKITRKVVMLYDAVKQLRWHGMERLPAGPARKYSPCALGYYITFRKESISN